MNYPFVCPNCNHAEIISMPINEYHSDNHFCSSCNTEMVREIKSLVCQCSIDTTGDFYKRTSI